MSLSSLCLFAGVYFLAVATPGPGIAALVSRVLAHGLRGVAPFIAGFVVGDLIWLTIAATGLAVVAHEFATLFVALKFAGAAYLLYVAWGLVRASPTVDPAAPPIRVAVVGMRLEELFERIAELTIPAPVLLGDRSLVVVRMKVQRIHQIAPRGREFRRALERAAK